MSPRPDLTRPRQAFKKKLGVRFLPGPAVMVGGEAEADGRREIQRMIGIHGCRCPPAAVPHTRTSSIASAPVLIRDPAPLRTLNAVRFRTLGAVCRCARPVGSCLGATTWHNSRRSMGFWTSTAPHCWNSWCRACSSSDNASCENCSSSRRLSAPGWALSASLRCVSSVRSSASASSRSSGSSHTQPTSSAWQRQRCGGGGSGQAFG